MNPTSPNAVPHDFLDDSHHEGLPDLALIQTALCYLMTRYSLQPCPGLVFTIIHHMQMVQAHPDMAGWPERRQTYDELLGRWKHIAERWRTSCREKTGSRRGAVH